MIQIDVSKIKIRPVWRPHFITKDLIVECTEYPLHPLKSMQCAQCPKLAMSGPILAGAVRERSSKGFIKCFVQD